MEDNKIILEQMEQMERVFGIPLPKYILEILVGLVGNGVPSVFAVPDHNLLWYKNLILN